MIYFEISTGFLINIITPFGFTELIRSDLVERLYTARHRVRSLYLTAEAVMGAALGEGLGLRRMLRDIFSISYRTNKC